MHIRETGKLCLGLASLAALLTSPAARAATFNVTDTAGLAAALTTAQNNDEDDVINLAAGTYDASGATFTYLADNSAGSVENFSLTLSGENRDTTILDGGDTRQIMSLKTDPGLGADAAADFTIRNLTFRNGRADALASTLGGGLLVDGRDASVTVDNCVFRDNFASNGGGGADLLSNLGDATLTNSVFIGNTTDGFAGGVELFGNVNVTAVNNVFFDNHAGDIAGGALIQYNFGDGPGERIAIVNNTVVSNTAVASGGGLYVALVDGATERADLFNNIIFGNTAGGEAVDLLLDDAVSLAEGATILLSNNDIGEFVSLCDEVDACDPNITEQDNRNDDPRLVDPANGDFHLASDSPLIDQGSSEAPSLPALDFEGQARVQGAAPDIGADEIVDEDVDGGGDGGGCSLIR